MLADPAPKPRSTRQKSAVAAALSQSQDFVTAQQLHTRLRETGIEIGLSTVYRALASMSELKEVDVLLREDGESLYRACSDDHHHHLVCRECGKAVEVTAEFVEAWAQDMAAAHGFSNINHTVEIFGTCATCAK